MQMAGYKSTDRGATWPATVTIGPTGSYDTCCKAFAFAPGNSAIRYAGGTYGSLVKLWRSSGGSTWDDATGNLNSFHASKDVIDDIWISPDDPDRLLVATTKGVFGTVDGGKTWNATSITAGTVDFVYHEAMGTLYAGTSSAGVHATRDGGATWQAMNDGLDTLAITCLDLDASNGLLFAGTDGGGGWRLSVAMPLMTDRIEVPASSGGKVTLSLDAAPDNAGRYYLMLGSLTGTSPGYPLPGGQATLPLVRDGYTNLVLAAMNSPLFRDFAGYLDGSGRGTARIAVPPLSSGAVGRVLYHAYCLAKPFDFASNPVRFEIVP